MKETAGYTGQTELIKEYSQQLTWRNTISKIKLNQKSIAKKNITL